MNEIKNGERGEGDATTMSRGWAKEENEIGFFKEKGRQKKEE